MRGGDSGINDTEISTAGRREPRKETTYTYKAKQLASLSPPV